MEGLLLAQVVDDLSARLPLQPLAWRFAGRDAVLLPLVPRDALWIYLRLPEPRIAVQGDAEETGSTPLTPFQALLQARAVGPLVGVEQPKLDRVVQFHFGPGEGFVQQPAVTLIAELTGRNGNLILVDESGVILGAHREVRSDRNRFREVRPGLAYQPPPPYDKADPRTLDRNAMEALLDGQSLRRWKAKVDGLGPTLTETVARLAGVSREEELTGASLDAALDALEHVVRDAHGAEREAWGRPDLATLRAEEVRAAHRKRVQVHLESQRTLLEKQERDAERARQAAQDADRLRAEGDLLLAYAHGVPANAATVTLPGFEGEDVTLQLDPRKSPAANAEARYDQARRREARAARADAQAARRAEERASIERDLAALDTMSDQELETRAKALEEAKRAPARGPGLRYPAPHGFTVVVGRNARENDAVTFKVARSRDVWLHVQGWTGSHVVILTEGREVPFDTVLFAAQLAAGHSKASGGDNVPVDYTLRKHVWKVKGAPAGAVHFTQQKTVYVTPSRNPTRDETEERDPDA